MPYCVVTIDGPRYADFHALRHSYLSALTAAGGLLLVGVALRLLRIREIPVADLLPALVVAPVLVQLTAILR